MFIANNQVRMHDTDMAGILYFARQFRFAHDALEDFVESEGFSFNQVFHNDDFVFVIVHVEADYFAPLQVGDKLETHLSIERVGNSSFTVMYRFYKLNQTLIGTAKTVHVTLDNKSRKKIPIPTKFKTILEKHLDQSKEH